MNQIFIDKATELVAKMTLPEKMAQMRYDAPAIERLSVPAYNWWNECLHGVARSGRATVFPQAIGMAASFNEELMFEVANAISDEARAKYNKYKEFGDTEIYQGLTYWSPNINIFRDPRWGRGHETYGEDVLLTSKMGVAFIDGLQKGKSPDEKYRKLDATIKHFAVHSGPEALRHEFNVGIDDETLYETYLEAFRYCIEKSDPSAVMGAYNAVNGEAACASKRLLKDILEDEFGFDGYVVSDCGAICDINNHHHITETAAESSALAINNGCILNCGSAFQYMEVAYSQGLLTEETITNAVIKLFAARFRLGMFDKNSYDEIPYDVIECKEHRDLNLKMAKESLVLLKNDGILPLKKAPQKIAVIGPNADDVSVLLGNYNGTPSRYKTILSALNDKADEVGAEILYARGCHVSNDYIHEWSEHPTREAIITAKEADVVIICMGINPQIEGEEGDAYNGDISGDKKDISLPTPQRKLFDEISKLGKPMIFVNVSGSCIDLSAQDEKCNAVLQFFYAGAKGGEALAETLFGDYSPSGRLPVTFYNTLDDLPSFEDYSMKGRTYRFYEGNPLYKFGYGLNYSKISENWLSANTVSVRNDGAFLQDYSVLHYETPEKRKLLGFKKVTLKPSEEVIIEF